MSVFQGKTFGQRLALLVTTGFGISLVSPFAPGTFGSFPGVLLAMWCVTWEVWLQAVFAIGMAFLAVPFCTLGEIAFQKKDDGRIVADEWMLFPIAVIGLPLWENLWLVPVCFVVTRLIDIIKPWPARGLQRLDGGFGVMIDDFAANLYSLGINWCIWLGYLHFLAR